MLADLDELVLKCRDERAKAYIGEAVACYKAGAYRAAIVSTWIAVAFDIIDKIRELSFTGDSTAETLIERLDTINRNRDLSQALAFERDLLSHARDSFELISPLEHSDLERIQQDRHRCAHPSHTAGSEIFTPSAELARAHIRSAVDHLLQHEPAQGKAAIETLIKMTDSQYFPDDPAKALTVLQSSPLRRARKSLVKSFVIHLLKEITRNSLEHRARHRKIAALNSTKQIHQDVWTEVVQQNFSKIVRQLDSVDDLIQAIVIADGNPPLASALTEDQVVRLNEVMLQLPISHVHLLTSEKYFKGIFAKAALDRVGAMTAKEVDGISFFGLGARICERVTSRLIRAHSGEDADAWAKITAENIDDFSEDQLRKIFEKAPKNQHVKESSGVNHIVDAVDKHRQLPTDLKSVFEDFRSAVDIPF